MNVEDIRLFGEVVAYGSISEAARKNHLTQQTLSRRVIAMERELGHRLFDRATPIVLTPTGKVFLSHAYEMLAVYDRMLTEIDRVGSSVRGQVKVKRYATDSFFHVLTSLIESLQAKYPGITFDMVSRNEDDRRLVATGALNIGFVRAVGRLGEQIPLTDDGLVYQRMRSNVFPLVFGVPDGHPLLRMEAPTLAEIAAFRIALPSFEDRGALPIALAELFAREGLTMRVDMVYSQSMLEYYSSAQPGSVYLFNEMYSTGSLVGQRRRYVPVEPGDGPYLVHSAAVYSPDNSNPVLPYVLEELAAADASLVDAEG